MRPALLLAVLLSAACSDYGLFAPGAAKNGYTEGKLIYPDTGVSDLPRCAEPDLAPRSLAQDESCLAQPITGMFTPVIKWNQPRTLDTFVAPVVGQLTDDNGNGMLDDGDVPDIAVANRYGAVYVLSGDDGSEIWHAGKLGEEPMSCAIGDVDGDGWNEVVASGLNGTEAFAGADGTVLWTASAYAGTKKANCGAVGLWDLDGNGSVEVVIGREIRNGADGTLVGKGTAGEGAGTPYWVPISTAADIDRDGDLEVVVGNALYDATGATIWSNGATDGFVAVGNFDSDNKGEIVVSGQGSVRLQDDDGTILWTDTAISGATTGPPTIADFDGDGEPEIGVAGNNEYVMIDGDGTVMWTMPTHDSSSGFTGSSVFDFEGDGAAEVVYADETDLYVYDGATGALKLDETEHSSETCSEYPTIADVDNDGHADIIYTSTAYSGGTNQGVTVVSDGDNSWMPGRPIWNQHAWSITNVEDDGSIPAAPTVNWDVYNNFRSGDTFGGEPQGLPDAVPVLHSVCADECVDGHLYLTVSLGNQGLAAIPAGISVVVWSDGVKLDTQWSAAAVEPGTTSDGMFFDLDADKVGAGLEVTVDDEKQVHECHDENNSITISDGLCE